MSEMLVAALRKMNAAGCTLPKKAADRIEELEARCAVMFEEYEAEADLRVQRTKEWAAERALADQLVNVLDGRHTHWEGHRTDCKKCQARAAWEAARS
jgi:hypothetical protein